MAHVLLPTRSKAVLRDTDGSREQFCLSRGSSPWPSDQLLTLLIPELQQQVLN